MPDLLDNTNMKRACRALRRVDPALGRWMDLVGPRSIRRRGSHFATLVRAIVGQQLSDRAAATINARVAALFPNPRFPRPGDVLACPAGKLRGAGLSGQKVTYLCELARAFSTGHLRSLRLDRRSDAGVVENLCQVKGIGSWTAEMFLIFSLRRPDVFSEGDLALRRGMERLTGRTLSPTQCSEHAQLWRPWRSVACLYLWEISHWEEN